MRNFFKINRALAAKKKIFLFIAAVCCAAMVNAAQFSGLKSIQSGGVNRQYFLYVPTYFESNNPMIISCHGMNQDYQYQKTQTQWCSMADTAGFVVVYPVGIAGSVWGMDYDTGWNMDDMTDVNFMLDIVSDVKANYNIDDSRVYMSGFDLGGAFTYYVARKAANSFAAFAPISGYDLMDNSTTTSRPVPIVHVHGTADNIMPYSGVDAYVKKWAQAQHCNITPVETSGNGYTCKRYTNGDCDVEVVLYSVTSRNHEPTNAGFHTSNAIWAFCKQYSIEGTPSDVKILTGLFSVASDKQVIFSSGNLQYNAYNNKWTFAENQFDFVGQDNENISSSYNGYIDLFGWGTSGYNGKNPYMISDNEYDYGDGESNIAGTDYDWGVYASISNGGEKEWRTLTEAEWTYLFQTRANAVDKLGNATVDGNKGLVLLPDTWQLPAGLSFSNTTNNWTTNTYTAEQWADMEAAGAVFLPASGRRTDNASIMSLGANSRGYYWTATANGEGNASYFQFRETVAPSFSNGYRSYGYSVRLVSDATGDTTAIEDISVAPKASKRIIGGVLLIERDGRVYNAFGTQIK